MVQRPGMSSATGGEAGPRRPDSAFVAARFLSRSSMDPDHSSLIPCRGSQALRRATQDMTLTVFDK